MSEPTHHRGIPLVFKLLALALVQGALSPVVAAASGRLDVSRALELTLLTPLMVLGCVRLGVFFRRLAWDCAAAAAVLSVLAQSLVLFVLSGQGLVRGAADLGEGFSLTLALSALLVIIATVACATALKRLTR